MHDLDEPNHTPFLDYTGWKGAYTLSLRLNMALELRTGNNDGVDRMVLRVLLRLYLVLHRPTITPMSKASSFLSRFPSIYIDSVLIATPPGSLHLCERHGPSCTFPCSQLFLNTLLAFSMIFCYIDPKTLFTSITKFVVV